MRIKFTFPLGINVVCLAITAVAPTIAIGPIVGTPLGLACSFGLLAAMEYQRSADGNLRSVSMAAVWLIRIFALTLEQMAYQDAFELRKSLPFGISAMWWGWIAPAVMAALDIMAHYITAARAAAISNAADHAANLARADQLDNDRREREAEKERAKYAQELELARITAETERAKAQASATAQAEAAKAQTEADRKRAELAAEAAGREAEAKRKQEEEARKRAEDQAEARRREQAERRKQEEEARKQQEAERKDKAAQEAAILAKLARWKAAQPDERAMMIEEAAAEISAKTGKTPTQLEIANVIGVSDRTIRDFLNSRLVKQAA